MLDKRFEYVIDRVKNRRLELGLSYQDLAKRTGLNKSTIQRYESGTIRNVPINKIMILADALYVDPAYLMGWQDSLTTITNTYNKNIEESLEKEVLTYKDSLPEENLILKEPNNEMHNELLAKESDAIDLLTPVLFKKGYILEYCENGSLGKITAKKKDIIWHLDFLLTLPPKDNKIDTDITYSKIFNLYNKILTYPCPLNKFSIIVSERKVFDKILKNKPNHLSIEVSVILVNLDTKKFIDEHIFI